MGILKGGGKNKKVGGEMIGLFEPDPSGYVLGKDKWFWICLILFIGLAIFGLWLVWWIAEIATKAYRCL